ncbi:Hypothetical predicted protein [Pelobates cultripes]|uniref:Uncharacterized protein n=1 Tax=Pelobates cultripes TaxID=61616 RepID=A0AAD1SH07_PELCU|nr:Hypothetical predicted protein [Pelobates cultripes]
MQLSFYADLSEANLAWRLLLKPFTVLLCLHNIQYHWRRPRALLIHHGDISYKITDMQGATNLLPTLGLQQNSVCVGTKPTSGTAINRGPYQGDIIRPLTGWSRSPHNGPEEPRD